MAKKMTYRRGKRGYKYVSSSYRSKAGMGLTEKKVRVNLVCLLPIYCWNLNAYSILVKIAIKWCTIVPFIFVCIQPVFGLPDSNPTPDLYPYQNVTDPQNWLQLYLNRSGVGAASLASLIYVGFLPFVYKGSDQKDPLPPPDNQKAQQ